MSQEFFFPGDRVLVFDHRLYKDDLSTPPDVTMQPATVLRWYGMRSQRYRWTYPSLIDVRFDRDLRESRAHFTNYVQHIKEEEREGSGL